MANRREDANLALPQDQSVQSTAEEKSLPADLPSANETTVSLELLRTQLLTLQNELREMGAQIQENKYAIAAVKKDEEARPWWRDAAIIVAVLALIFSVVTAVFSDIRLQQDRIADARAELRAVLQRLGEIQRETEILGVQTVYDELTRNTLEGVLTQELSLLTNQAYEMINNEEISEYVTANEYNQIGQSLALIGRFGLAEELFVLAAENATNITDEVSALRYRARLNYFSGQLESGREIFEEARAIDQKYPGETSYFLDWTAAYTELSWATIEAQVAQCQASQEHLQRAFQLAQSLAPQDEQLLSETTAAADEIDNRCS